MSIFEQLTQAIADYETLWAAFRASKQQAADITRAVAARIAADRAQSDERTATLTTQSQDMARPEVVRKLAQQELDRLQERTFAPTSGETDTFDSAMGDARAALQDAVTVQGQLRDLFAAANKELSALRASTLGNSSCDSELARRHLDGEQRAFNLLGKTGRPGEQS